MIEKECTTYSCTDYLDCNDEDSVRHTSDDISIRSDMNKRPRGNKITPDDRMKIVDWCYSIVDQCKFERENVAIAMTIADRFMSTISNASQHQLQYLLCHRGQYQLVAVTSLYISVKLNEQVAFSSKDFATLSHGMYSTEDIEDMEWLILQGLSWRLYSPTSLQVADQILSLMLSQAVATTLEQGTWDFIKEEVAYQTENSVRDYYFTTQRPSTIAAAAILNAIERVNSHDYGLLMMVLSSALREFDFDSPLAIEDARSQLLRLMDENEESECGSDEMSQSTVCPILEVSVAIMMSPESDYAACISSDDDSCATVRHEHDTQAGRGDNPYLLSLQNVQ